MRANKQAALLASVIVYALAVMALGACGVRPASTGPGGAGGTPGTAPNGPDSVRIAIDAPSVIPLPPGSTPAVTLRDAMLVRHLYATIYALPALPAERACTDELGPHYTLTFQQGTTTLASVQAHDDGCRPVTIAGNSLVRQGTSAFWQELAQAIVAATPPLSPDHLAIATAPHAGQPPQSAQITSATSVRQLYDAILALPRVSAVQGCPTSPAPIYQLVFFAGEQAVPASVDDSCQTVEVDGGYQWRGGTFAVSEQFQTLFRSVLAGVTFAPARPDQLAVSVEKARTASHDAQIANTKLMLALYGRVFTLPPAAPQPGCPSDADKLAGTYTWATLTFTQWDLPLAQITTYEGSCRFVQLAPTGPWLGADQAFWDLIHQALSE